MAQPGNFVVRFKYTILALLLVVTAAYGYYLFHTYWPAASSEKYSVPVAVMVDGTIRIDGALFTSPAKLKVKVAQIQREHPDAGFSIQAPAGETFEAIAKAVALLQKSGAKTVWVINPQPKKDGP